jgi:hypothetical protein
MNSSNVVLEESYHCPANSFINFYPPLSFKDCTCSWGLRRAVAVNADASTSGLPDRCENFTAAHPKGVLALIEIALDDLQEDFIKSPGRQVTFAQKVAHAVGVTMEQVAVVEARRWEEVPGLQLAMSGRSRLRFLQEIGSTVDNAVVKIEITPTGTSRKMHHQEISDLETRLTSRDSDNEQSLQLAMGSLDVKIVGIKVVDLKSDSNLILPAAVWYAMGGMVFLGLLALAHNLVKHRMTTAATDEYAWGSSNTNTPQKGISAGMLSWIFASRSKRSARPSAVALPAGSIPSTQPAPPAGPVPAHIFAAHTTDSSLVPEHTNPMMTKSL